MNSRTSLAFAAALAALATLVALVSAKPSGSRVAEKMDLANVLNRTVCPIKIEFDVDPDRVPKRIKLMKCGGDVNQWCSAMHIPKHECCQHQHDTVLLSCVELQDTVQVYYPKLDQTQHYNLAVGCTCVMQEAVQVADATPS